MDAQADPEVAEAGFQIVPVDAGGRPDEAEGGRPLPEAEEQEEPDVEATGSGEEVARRFRPPPLHSRGVCGEGVS